MELYRRFSSFRDLLSLLHVVGLRFFFEEILLGFVLVSIASFHLFWGKFSFSVVVNEHLLSNCFPPHLSAAIELL